MTTENRKKVIEQIASAYSHADEVSKLDRRDRYPALCGGLFGVLASVLGMKNGELHEELQRVKAAMEGQS